jgi:HEAT repeat protein
MLIYCTACWQENPAESKKCLRCGATLETNNMSYIAKLIKALSHPEPDIVQRAAWILGELKVREAVEPLISLLKKSTELGALESAVEALGKIGDEKSTDILSRLIISSYLPVRLKAVDALQKIGSPNALNVLRMAINDRSSSVSKRARQALKLLHQGL